MDIDPSQNSFPLGLPGSCLPRTGVFSPNAADAVVDHGDKASRLCSDRLSPLPETETSGSCLGSSGDDQLEDDEMALVGNETALEQPSLRVSQLCQATVDVKRGRSQNRSRFAPSLQIFGGTNPPLKILAAPLPRGLATRDYGGWTNCQSRVSCFCSSRSSVLVSSKKYK